MNFAMQLQSGTFSNLFAKLYPFRKSYAACRPLRTMPHFIDLIGDSTLDRSRSYSRPARPSDMCY